MVDIQKDRKRPQSPLFKKALLQLGIEEESMQFISKRDYLIQHLELRNASKEVQNRRYFEYEKRRLSKINKVNQMRHDIMNKSCINSSRELNSDSAANVINNPLLNKKDYFKFELQKMHNVNNIKTIIDFAVNRAESQKRHEEKMKIKLERKEEHYRKLRLNQHEKELRLKYSNERVKETPLSKCSVKRFNASGLISSEDIGYFNDNAKLLPKDVNIRRLNEEKAKLKNDQKEKEREQKEENRKQLLKERNKELMKQARDKEKLISKMQRQAQSRSQKDLHRKMKIIDTRWKIIEENQKQHWIQLNNSARGSKEKQKISQIKLKANTQNQFESNQKKFEEYNHKHALCDQRLEERRDQSKTSLMHQLKLNSLRTAKIRKQLQKNHSENDIRNAQLIQKIAQKGEKALKAKEQRAKEIIDLYYINASKEEKSREKGNEIKRKNDYEQKEKLIQYTQKIGKLEALQTEKKMKVIRKRNIEEEIRNRKEEMFMRSINIAHSGCFTDKKDYYKKVFNNVEYSNYICRKNATPSLRVNAEGDQVESFDNQANVAEGIDLDQENEVKEEREDNNFESKG